MTAWKRVLQGSGCCFGAAGVIFIVLWLETTLQWGWSTAGNWGYFLIWLFISAGLMLISALVAGVVMLVLRSRS
jgi:hypothetical protein